MIRKFKIDKDYPLKPGDKVELEFDLIGPIDWVYFRSTQVALLEWHLNKKNPYWRYVSMENLSDGVILQFEIIEPTEDADPKVLEAGITGAFIAAFICGAFLFAYLSLREVRLIKELEDEPSDITKSKYGLGWLGVSLFLLMVYFLLRKLK